MKFTIITNVLVSTCVLIRLPVSARHTLLTDGVQRNDTYYKNSIRLWSGKYFARTDRRRMERFQFRAVIARSSSHHRTVQSVSYSFTSFSIFIHSFPFLTFFLLLSLFAFDDEPIRFFCFRVFAECSTAWRFRGRCFCHFFYLLACVYWNGMVSFVLGSAIERKHYTDGVDCGVSRVCIRVFVWSIQIAMKLTVTHQIYYIFFSLGFQPIVDVCRSRVLSSPPFYFYLLARHNPTCIWHMC